MERQCFLTFVACLALVLSGCDNKPRRFQIEGNVAVDGTPLVFGSIQFTPEGIGPRASAIIENGHYLIDSSRGPLAGSMTVVIHAPELPKDRPLPESSSQWIHDTSNSPETLPERYNSKSELKATVTLSGPNTFDFDLQSK